MQILSLKEMFSDNSGLNNTDFAVVPDQREFVLVHDNLLETERIL